ncbi:aromatic acid/H+ symport family MFS transporter [Amycolatopsis acidicola]|uniref:Aromatic acid/H+ symport family MFS transporter n=1 Tax=Amycolatopsis acidicola TaxID=2596893 RepID=A0A5N0UVB3_9PSEU|nr:aromatic acid/H+ symport family MFS transporter [Amycolatopsis acidicola]KAA9156748.1 aromatic acid/H+ symport family MFS transporter [Amycolatopsis acidicola]
MTLFARPTTTRGALGVVWLCLAVTVLDGLDLTMYGTAVPSLVKSHQWGLDSAMIGLVGSLSLLGMLIGAAVSGSLADIVGRRPVILACVASFSVFTVLCAVAPNAELFGVFRFVAGLGFGGALPSTIALTQDYVPPQRKQFFNGFIQLGFPIGGIVGALLALVLIPAFGWRSVFAFGGILALVLFPVVFFLLPESTTYLANRGRTRTRVNRTEAIRQLFRPGFRLASLLFPLITFCGLMISYGMTTWLPQILVANGYGFASGLSFLLAFYLGDVVGMLGVTALAERFSPRKVIGLSFFICGLAAIFLVLRLPAFAIVLLVFGVGVFCTAQTAVSGFAGIYYPASARGTALGWDVGIGRLGGVCGPLIIGAVIGAGFSASTAFLLFAVAGVLACVLTVAVPRTGVCDGAPASPTEKEITDARTH